MLWRVGVLCFARRYSLLASVLPEKACTFCSGLMTGRTVAGAFVAIVARQYRGFCFEVALGSSSSTTARRS